MKVLSIVIPVYNTEKYIKRCMDSILLDKILDKIEIIAVNDGSKDNSIKILDEYKNRFPSNIIVINKENGGHGSTINYALKIATGKYFRVLDSDDWFDSKNFIKFVEELENENSDLIITNYRKEFIFNGCSEYLSWELLKEDITYDFNNFNLDLLEKEYFTMANSTYKTEILRESKLVLLEKTFYVDMQFNIVPVPFIKTFKFFDLDIYRYFIGRPDQSMNLQNFVKNRSNHETVMKFLIEYYNKINNNISENQKKYIKLILYYMLTTHYYIYCVYGKSDTSTLYKEITAFDNYLKESNIELYNMMYQIGKIRYNRKIKFLSIKINSQLFNRIMEFISRISKRRLK